MHHPTPETTSSQNVLACVKISDVYRALGGPELRHGRWRAFWRDGDGYNVSMDDSRGVWHDFATDEGGGVLDLVVRVRGGTRADALRWYAELAGVQIEDTPLSAADRERWLQQRRELERDLPTARLWRRAAALMSEEVLTVLKAALFAPDLPQPQVNEIREVEGLLSRLKSMDGFVLLEEYRWWLSRYPGMTAALVDVARRRERAERQALAAYLRQTDEQAVA